MRKVIIGLALVGLAQLFACQSDPEPKAAQPERVEASNKAKVREMSELAMVMRDMHEVLKKVKPIVREGQNVPDSLDYPYDLILTAGKTPGMGEGPAYEGFARVYLDRVDSLYLNPSIEAYNGVIDGCVSCHNSYCTGPLSKIKKLGINH